MTTPCPKCGGTTISSRKATSTGRPMDTVACQSCIWFRVVVGALPPAPLSDEALVKLLAVAEKDSRNSELADFHRALDPSGGTVTPSVIVALVREVQEARRTGPTEGVRLTPMEQQQRAANGAPYGYSPLWPLVKP